jgi:hypothetical protein
MESVACVKLVPRDRLCRDLYPSSQLSFDLVVFSWGNTLVSSFFLFYLHFFFFDWSLWKSHSHFSAILLDIIIVFWFPPSLSLGISRCWALFQLFFSPPFFNYCTMSLSLSLARTIHEVRRLPSRWSLERIITKRINTYATTTRDAILEFLTGRSWLFDLALLLFSLSLSLSHYSFTPLSFLNTYTHLVNEFMIFVRLKKIITDIWCCEREIYFFQFVANASQK